MKGFEIEFSIDGELKSTFFDAESEEDAIDRFYEEYEEDSVELVRCTIAGEYDKDGVFHPRKDTTK